MAESEMNPDGATGANDWRKLAQEVAQMMTQIDANTDAIATLRHDLRMFLGLKSLRPVKASPKARLEYPEQFLSFWAQYPLKRDKRKALLAWNRAIKRASNGAIIEGAKRYASDANRVAQFTKYAEGWLNADGWEDEPLPVREVSKKADGWERPNPIPPNLGEEECPDCGGFSKHREWCSPGEAG